MLHVESLTFALQRTFSFRELPLEVLVYSVSVQGSITACLILINTETF